MTVSADLLSNSPSFISSLCRNVQYRIDFDGITRILALRSVGPVDCNALDLCRAAQPEMGSCIACRQVARVRMDPSPKFGGTFRLHSYASTDSKTRPIDLNGKPRST